MLECVVTQGVWLIYQPPLPLQFTERDGMPWTSYTVFEAIVKCGEIQGNGFGAHLYALMYSEPSDILNLPEFQRAPHSHSQMALQMAIYLAHLGTTRNL